MVHSKQLRPAVLALAALGLLGFSPLPGTASPATAPQPPAVRDAATTLSITDLYCLSLGGGRAECNATVSGGTGSYTYTWQPTPYAGSEGFVLIYCSAYKFNDVYLTVTDSNGATDSASTRFYCGDAV